MRLKYRPPEKRIPIVRSTMRLCGGEDTYLGSKEDTGGGYVGDVYYKHMGADFTDYAGSLQYVFGIRRKSGRLDFIGLKGAKISSTGEIQSPNNPAKPPVFLLPHVYTQNVPFIMGIHLGMEAHLRERAKAQEIIDAYKI